MGAALGYALAGTTAVTLAVFVALGIGMAVPYVTLALFPGWRRRLPRPGPWLLRFKQLLAFPLYATVIWLAWVLGAQRDNDAVVRLLLALLCLGFALWTWRIVRTGGARPWGIAGVAALAGAIGARVAAVPRRRRRAAARSRRAPGRPPPARRVAALTRRRASRELTASGRAGVRRFHRGVVRHLPGEQAPRSQHRGRSARRSRGRTSRWCAPTGRVAIPTSRAR